MGENGYFCEFYHKLSFKKNEKEKYETKAYEGNLRLFFCFVQ